MCDAYLSPCYFDLWNEYLLFNDLDVSHTRRDRSLSFTIFFFPFLMSLKSWLGRHFKLRFKAIQLKTVLRSHWLPCGYVSLNQRSGRRLGFCLGKKPRRSPSSKPYFMSVSCESLPSWVLLRRRTGLGARGFRLSHVHAFLEGAAVMYAAAQCNDQVEQSVSPRLVLDLLGTYEGHLSTCSACIS